MSRRGYAYVSEERMCVGEKSVCSVGVCIGEWKVVVMCSGGKGYVEKEKDV